MPSIIDHIDQLLNERYLGKVVHSRNGKRAITVRCVNWDAPSEDGVGSITLIGDGTRYDRRSFDWYEQMPEAISPAPATEPTHPWTFPVTIDVTPNNIALHKLVNADNEEAIEAVTAMVGSNVVSMWAKLPVPAAPPQ